jgi:hypothetical protein
LRSVSFFVDGGIGHMSGASRSSDDFGGSFRPTGQEQLDGMGVAERRFHSDYLIRA